MDKTAASLQRYAKSKRRGSIRSRLSAIFVGRRLRLLVAMLVAPVVVVPIIVGAGLIARFSNLLEVLAGERYFFESAAIFLSAMMKYSVLALLVSYLLTLLYGLPVHVCLALLNKGSPDMHALAGGLGGLLLALVAPVSPAIQGLIILSGAAVAVVFWRIAGYQPTDGAGRLHH